MKFFQRHITLHCGDAKGPEGPTAILKRESEERFLLGVVMEPGVADAHNHVTDAVEIRKAAHRFMAESQTLGLMHRWQVNDSVTVLESYVLPEEATIGQTVVRKGTWLLGVRIADDDLWAQVQRGELTGFSIGGFANESPADASETQP